MYKKFPSLRPYLLIVFCLFNFQPVFAAFEIDKLGAKASALNDSYSVLADDSWGILYNPAQVVRLEGAQASLGYSRPHLNFGNFQANLVSGFFTRETMGTGYGVGAIFVDTNVFYREIIGLFNAGHCFGEKESDWDIAFGANLKILSLRRGDPSKPFDPALVPQTMNRFTADIGAHTRYKRFFIGFSLQNLIPANIGAVVKDIVPVEMRIGLGARRLWEIEKAGIKVSPALEISNRNENTVVTGAAEIELLDFVSFQLGAGATSVTMGFSVFLNQFKKEFDKKRLRLDAPRSETVYHLNVAYVYPISRVDAVGSPLVSMGFLF